MSDWMNAESHADRALEMYERGRWDEAAAELRKALSLNPDQAEWHFNLGLSLEAAGRDAEALAAYERASELLEGQIDPLLAVGHVAARLGRYEQSIDCFQRVLKVEPTCEDAYAQLMECLVRLGRHEEVETTYYLSQQVLAEPSARCLAVMGESLLQRRMHERAGWCLREALRLEPALPRLRARLGSVYAATGRQQRALHLFLRDLRDDPGNIETLLDYGELLADLGRQAEAAEKFHRVLELEPANVDAHFNLGELALSAGRLEKAHLEFELVLKLDPEFPEIRLAIAEALLRRGRLADAQRCLREQMEMDEAQIAAMDSPRGDPAPVEDAVPDAVDSKPRSDEPDLRRLGELLLRAQLPAEAARILQRVVDRRGEDAEVLRKLALAHFQAGHRGAGASVSRRVLRLEPNCVHSMHNLALAALEQRRLDLAAGWIHRGLRIDRHDEGLRRLRVRIWLRWTAALLLVLGRRMRIRMRSTRRRAKAIAARMQRACINRLSAKSLPRP
jgi:tetratricopeptide (TPR) repeat protein